MTPHRWFNTTGSFLYEMCEIFDWCFFIEFIPSATEGRTNYVISDKVNVVCGYLKVRDSIDICYQLLLAEKASLLFHFNFDLYFNFKICGYN